MRAALVRYAYADAALRQQLRAEHVSRLQQLADAGVVVVAGPIADGTGAIVVLAVADEPAARAVMDADPYVRGGAVVDYTVEPFDGVVAAPGLSAP